MRRYQGLSADPVLDIIISVLLYAGTPNFSFLFVLEQVREYWGDALLTVWFIGDGKGWLRVRDVKRECEE